MKQDNGDVKICETIVNRNNTILIHVKQIETKWKF